MNLHLFFAVASPDTLASLCIDVRNLLQGPSEAEVWTDDDFVALRDAAFRTLAAKVGESQAIKMIQASVV